MKDIIDAIWMSTVMSAVFWTSGVILFVILKAAGAF